MCGAFGKPQGTVAVVHVGQVIMSICTKLQNKEHVIEALCRAKFKFSGHQKNHLSKKWGLTKFNVGEFENMVAGEWLIADGCEVKCIPDHQAGTHESPGAAPSSLTPTNKSYFLSKRKRPLWLRDI